MKNRILEIAVDQFSRYGIRTVTMEDIARLAGISKKTIYQEFKDKKELVNASFSSLLEADRERLQGILNTNDGVIEHLVLASQVIRDRISNLNPMAVLEVQKYFPETWKIFECYREDVILPDLIHVLEKGKQLGYFRPEINSVLMATMRVSQITLALDPANSPKEGVSLLEMQISVMDHFLHGIFTEKGREAYLKIDALKKPN
jgi:AcrR family transcriptional regulator